MRTMIKLERIYSDENMIEILIHISKLDISACLSCYTSVNELSKLRDFCKEFSHTMMPFTWFIGTREHAYFRMIVEPYDKLGHNKVGVEMINHKSELEIIKCEFYFLLDLGLIGDIGNNINALINNENGSLEIQQN